MTSRIKCKSCGAESIAGGTLFCLACVAEMVEFLHEVAKPAYADSDPSSLLETLQSRAQALLQKSPCGITPRETDRLSAEDKAAITHHVMFPND